MDRIYFLEKRVHEKIDDYAEYGFSKTQEAALMTFFDLAQEFESIEDLYRICIIVIKSFFGYDSKVYAPTDKGSMALACTVNSLIAKKSLIPLPIPVSVHPQTNNNSYFIPIIGNKTLLDRLPATYSGEILGVLEIEQTGHFDETERFFFQKFANRMGYTLHNKLLTWKNINHLKFIRSLVKDIDHNIITPNIAFKLYIKKMQSALNKCREIRDELTQTCATLCIEETEQKEHLNNILEKLNNTAALLKDQLEGIKKHHDTMSLFLETMLRHVHFEKGHYVLNKRECGIKKDIILPQLKELENKIRDSNIEVVDEYGPQEEEELMLVDVGLLSQVYANLFTNAIKYIAEAQGDVRPLKYIAYGKKIILNYFANEMHGIKYYVFNTGRYVPENEREMIFLEGYRASNAPTAVSGTGQGLYFVKEIIRVHGGMVGYEPAQNGNIFYFILPLTK
ncbi:MAG: HAMP domain-containing sensor histidine kinase [Pseudomonadota bacterium]